MLKAEYINWEGVVKRIVSLIIGLVAAIGFVGNAAAAYPLGTPTVTTNNSSPTAGSQVTLTASGFCANTVVVFTGGGQTLGQTTTDASGSASITITAPQTTGTLTITATASGACSASASLSLTVRAPGGGAGIPATGSDSSSTLSYGLLAVGAGAGLIGFAGLKRRRPALAA